MANRPMKCVICGKPLTPERLEHERELFQELRAVDPGTPFWPVCSERCEIVQLSEILHQAHDEGVINLKEVKEDFRQWAEENGHILPANPKDFKQPN
jgi:endogenous inhibitor of DNA gyrase (YacG/DUF329 family)